MEALLSQEVWHLGFVVRDVEKTINNLRTLLGIKSWTKQVLEPQDATVHGKAVNHRIKIAMGSFGTLQIELLQPVKGKTVYDEHLDQRGESFHHIAIRIPEQKLQEVLVHLQKKGGKIIQTGRVGAGLGYFYIKLKELDLVLELNPTK